MFVEGQEVEVMEEGAREVEVLAVVMEEEEKAEEEKVEEEKVVAV